MSDQRVIIGNSLRVLKELEPESIDVCVTSPPYWGLRDYGSEPEIYGGDDACTHEWSEHREPIPGIVSSLHCLECGATAEWMKKEASE